MHLWIPSVLGTLAYLAMSVSSYSLWGILGFGFAVSVSLIMAVNDVDKLVICCVSIFTVAFIVSLRGTEKKFKGSSVLYYAFGWV